MIKEETEKYKVRQFMKCGMEYRDGWSERRKRGMDVSSYCVLTFVYVLYGHNT